MPGNSNSTNCVMKLTHSFFECSITQKLWKQPSSYLEEYLILSQLSPQTAFFGFLSLTSDLGLIQKHILMIFKIYLCKSGKCEGVTLNGLLKKYCECNDQREKHCK